MKLGIKLKGLQLNKRIKEELLNKKKKTTLILKIKLYDNIVPPSFNQHRLTYKNKQVEHLAKNTTIQKIHGIDTNKISNIMKNMYKRTEDFIIATIAQIKSITISSNRSLIISVVSICLIIVIMFSFYRIRGTSVEDEPNFYNLDAYVIKNPYAQVDLYGQCTWFAWGRFYELYDYFATPAPFIRNLSTTII